MDKINPPEDFCKLIFDFYNDLFKTYPEVKMFMEADELELTKTFDISSNLQAYQSIYDHCKSKYPERFFDILYKNDEMFTDDSIDTTFLPNVNFDDLWKCELSENTRSTIWNYLQLLLFIIIKDVDSKDSFGDTAKLFEAIGEKDLKNKMKETLEGIQDMFSGFTDLSGIDLDDLNMDDMKDFKSDMSNINLEDLPDASEIHDHLNGMLDGKIGTLAKEIAHETIEGLNDDVKNANNINEVFEKMFKNPTKLLSLIKDIGTKLDKKIKSGDIDERELLSEATQMMEKMKNMPGMGNMEEMLSKMAGGKNKFNMNAFNQKMNNNKQRERMLNELKRRKENKERNSNLVNKNVDNKNDLEFSKYSTGDKNTQTLINPPPGHKKKRNKKKKKPKVVDQENKLEENN